MEEIGDIMGLSLSNVKVRLHRTRLKLREQSTEIWESVIPTLGRRFLTPQ
ncbi:MAG: hypothetical protein LBF19_07840 [Prevotellaceae bacterium]|nr:hypothetical protein [Prevotellaceae bacterium]